MSSESDWNCFNSDSLIGWPDFSSECSVLNRSWGCEMDIVSRNGFNRNCFNKLDRLSRWKRTSRRIALMGGTLSSASPVWAGLGSWTLSPGMTSLGTASRKRTVSPGIDWIKMASIWTLRVLWIRFLDRSVIVWEEVVVEWVQFMASKKWKYNCRKHWTYPLKNHGRWPAGT